MRSSARFIVALSAALGAAVHAAGTVGMAFAPDFPVFEEASLQRPVIGFGAAGAVTRTPVIFLHGNNDTPLPTACNPYGRMQAMAQFLADNGYAPSELWALGSGLWATRATRATWRLTRPCARASPTQMPPTCPTCGASCARCWPEPAQRRSTLWRTAWA